MKYVLVLLICFILIIGCTTTQNDQMDFDKEENFSPDNIPEKAKLKITETNKPENKLVDDTFIVANPFDLSQISAVSKFRSCVGHDYSGLNVKGELETQRSMKHYLNGVDSVVGYSNKVKVYAPFDGKIAQIEDDFASFEGKQRGKQIWLSGNSAGDWVFVFFHVDLLESIIKGTEVKTGQHIGYGNLDNAPNFDITLKKFGFLGPNTIESPFLHMDSEVMEQYTKRGLNLEDFVVSKSARDSKPCSCSGEYCAFPSTTPESKPEDWVLVR